MTQNGPRLRNLRKFPICLRVRWGRDTHFQNVWLRAAVGFKRVVQIKGTAKISTAKQLLGTGLGSNRGPKGYPSTQLQMLFFYQEFFPQFHICVHMNVKIVVLICQKYYVCLSLLDCSLRLFSKFILHCQKICQSWDFVPNGKCYITML